MQQWSYIVWCAYLEDWPAQCNPYSLFVLTKSLTLLLIPTFLIDPALFYIASHILHLIFSSYYALTSLEDIVRMHFYSIIFPTNLTMLFWETLFIFTTHPVGISQVLSTCLHAHHLYCLNIHTSLSLHKMNSVTLQVIITNLRAWRIVGTWKTYWKN